MTAPISVELCLAGRDLTEPRPSPDGRRLAFVARGAGPATIQLIDLDGGPERVLTTGPAPASGRGMFGGCFDWCDDASAIVYAAVDGQLWRQPLDGAAPVALTNTDRLHQAPAVAGSFVAYMIDQAEIAVLDLATGRRARLDTGADGFCFDPAIIIVDDDALLIAWQAWSAPSMPWDDAAIEIARFDPDRFEVVERRRIAGIGAIQQPRWCPDGTLVSIRDDHGWLQVWHEDRCVLDGEREAAGPTWGPGQQSVAVSPDGRHVAIAVNEAGFGRLLVTGLGAASAGEQDDAGQAVELGRGIHGQVRWAGASIVALRSGARTPTQIVVYTPDTPDMPDASDTTGVYQRRILAVGPAAGWDAIPLIEPEPFTIDTDAGPLPARHYRAMGRTGRTGRMERLLCLVHGGPTDQWPVMFLPRVAFWQAQGFDVLVVDPRGTTGHGRRHQQGLHGGWGVDDVEDTAQLIAAAQQRLGLGGDRTAIAGSSSGGLTVLSVMARHPHLVAGGIAAYPVSDLAGLADSDHRFEAHYTSSLVGPLETEQDLMRYRERSPVAWAEMMMAPISQLSRSPLLLLHGDADPVVPVEHSRRLVAALEQLDAPVEYHEFVGEGHGWRDPAVRRLDLELSVAFLDRICPA